MTMLVTVEWTRLALNDRRLDLNRCLYAYLHPDSQRLLYIGKAYSQTIRSRLQGPHKEILLESLRDLLGKSFDWIPDILHGRVRTEPGRRVTKPVLRDVESLLIKRIRPPENLNCKKSRMARPGMTVECIGDWPYKRRVFHDVYDASG